MSDASVAEDRARPRLLPYGPLMTATLRPLQRAFLILNRGFMAPLIRAGFGWLLGNPLTGHYLVLVTRGRRSGRRREAPLGYVIRDGGVYVVAGYGRTTPWYRNLLDERAVEVILPTRRFRADAAPVDVPAAWAVAYRDLIGSFGILGRWDRWRRACARRRHALGRARGAAGGPADTVRWRTTPGRRPVRPGRARLDAVLCAVRGDRRACRARASAGPGLREAWSPARPAFRARSRPHVSCHIDTPGRLGQLSDDQVDSCDLEPTAHRRSLSTKAGASQPPERVIERLEGLADGPSDPGCRSVRNRASGSADAGFGRGSAAPTPGSGAVRRAGSIRGFGRGSACGLDTRVRARFGVRARYAGSGAVRQRRRRVRARFGVRAGYAGSGAVRRAGWIRGFGRGSACTAWVRLGIAGRALGLAPGSWCVRSGGREGQAGPGGSARCGNPPPHPTRDGTIPRSGPGAPRRGQARSA